MSTSLNEYLTSKIELGNKKINLRHSQNTEKKRDENNESGDSKYVERSNRQELQIKTARRQVRTHETEAIIKEKCMGKCF